MDKDSAAWRRHPCTKKRARHKQMLLTDQQVKRVVLDGSIPSEAWDTACTSHTGMVGETFIQTKCMSTKIFALANGHPTPATNIAMLEHRVREPERTVNMVPDLENQYLLRGGKFAKAGYVSV